MRFSFFGFTCNPLHHNQTGKELQPSADLSVSLKIKRSLSRELTFQDFCFFFSFLPRVIREHGQSKEMTSQQGRHKNQLAPVWIRKRNIAKAIASPFDKNRMRK